MRHGVGLGDTWRHFGWDMGYGIHGMGLGSQLMGHRRVSLGDTWGHLGLGDTSGHLETLGKTWGEFRGHLEAIGLGHGVSLGNPLHGIRALG